MNMPPPPPPGMPPPPPAWDGGASTPSSATGQPLASPGLRIAARLIDGVIGFVIGLILAGILIAGDAGTSFAGFGGGGGVAKRWLVGVLGLGFALVYEGVLTGLKGGTPGKLILGLRVVKAADGSPVDMGSAILRWAVPGAFGIVPILGGLAGFVVWIISLVFLFSDKLRQTVSDKVAKTLVVGKG